MYIYLSKSIYIFQYLSICIYSYIDILCQSFLILSSFRGAIYLFIYLSFYLSIYNILLSFSGSISKYSIKFKHFELIWWKYKRKVWNRNFSLPIDIFQFSLLEVELPYEPSFLSVRSIGSPVCLSVGRSVCQNFPIFFPPLD